MPVTKKPPKIEKVPKKEYKIIRVDPSLRMPIADQIKWAKALSTMPLEEKKKILRMLLDGMFKDIETMEREGIIYPKRKLRIINTSSLAQPVIKAILSEPY